MKKVDRINLPVNGCVGAVCSARESVHASSLLSESAFVGALNCFAHRPTDQTKKLHFVNLLSIQSLNL